VCSLLVNVNQVFQQWFQESEGPAAVAIAFFFSQRHFCKCAPSVVDFENGVVPEALITAGGLGDLAFTTPFNFQENLAIGGGNAERRTEEGLALIAVDQSLKQFCNALWI
jgi:hypothetical protein